MKVIIGIDLGGVFQELGSLNDQRPNSVVVTTTGVHQRAILFMLNVNILFLFITFYLLLCVPKLLLPNKTTFRDSRDFES